MVRAAITHASSYILLTFFFFLWGPPSDTHTTVCTATTNMMNSRRAAPPWRHLIIEKSQGNVLILYPPTLPPRLFPPSLWLSSLLPSPVRLFAVQSGVVHVSRSGGSAALFCALVHRITALDNRVVVEGESGPGPGAGPGEAPWLFIARSPKTCPSFFYSPF